jgi:glycosyltransferase involved in cell wall biosynthesis
MKILVLDTGKEWGGGTNSLLELLKRIDRRRFEVHACFYHDYARDSGSSVSHALASLEIPFIRLPGLRQPPWAKAAKEFARGLLAWHRGLRDRTVFAVERAWRISPRAAQLARLLREGGFDLLYLNNQPSSNLEGYLAGEAACVPVVQHCRIDATLNASEIAAANRVARRIICVSRGVADSLAAQGIDDDKLVVVHNGIDGAQLVPTPQKLDDVPAGALVVGTVGQLVRRKSVDDLLRALEKVGTSGAPVAERRESMYALIVGTGPEEDALRTLAASLGLADRAHFAGFQKEPLSWLNAMDVFVLASSREGLPRVILEAMLLAKPVVAARAVGSTELVVDGITGFLYPHGDTAALAAHIALLRDDEALRRRLGQAGHERVLADFSIERYVAGVERELAAALIGP